MEGNGALNVTLEHNVFVSRGKKRNSKVTVRTLHATVAWYGCVSDNAKIVRSVAPGNYFAVCSPSYRNEDAVPLLL